MGEAAAGKRPALCQHRQPIDPAVGPAIGRDRPPSVTLTYCVGRRVAAVSPLNPIKSRRFVSFLVKMRRAETIPAVSELSWMQPTIRPGVDPPCIDGQWLRAEP
jgi:hypothetical protein